MDWFFTTLYWYLFLFVIGLVFFPLTRKIFKSFFDEGYVFSKTLGILLISYSTFVLGTFKILPFSQTSLYLITILFAFFNFFILIKDTQPQHILSPPKKSKSRKMQRPQALTPNKFDYHKLFIFIFEELLFFCALLFLTIVRGQEPSLRGLEKFMDFGFINSILKSTTFPPLDMWYGPDPTHPLGFPINYYYFGHLTGAMLIKLTGISAFVGYNLILATIFAQGITLTFSLAGNLVYLYQTIILKVQRISYRAILFIGILGSFILNFAGNLHTIYAFTKGYPPDKPVPFWEILTGFNPAPYWYPNATRFIPFTIHEFPSYSYVVADLHGHVFDIPFVILTLALLLTFFIKTKAKIDSTADVIPSPQQKQSFTSLRHHSETKIKQFLTNHSYLLTSLFLGLMIAVHYMTNAWDSPIYLLLTAMISFFLFRFTAQFFIFMATILVSAILFSLPFSLHFTSIVSGIGINCSPNFLVTMKKLGPFLFEKGNCQISPWWMLLILWGFFLMSFLLFIGVLFSKRRKQSGTHIQHSFEFNVAGKIITITSLDLFVLSLFLLGIFLITIPEFVYLKDIYPAHFRANTMFKFGYQAFMMMSIASAYVFYRLRFLAPIPKYGLKVVYAFFFFFIFIYPFFAFPSYYGNLKKPVQLDGSTWLATTYPEDKEIVDYLNTQVKGQPVVLEAQGDSYTDFERISAYTGFPTIAGWWVHEWLWRGSADVVGVRIPDIQAIYESDDVAYTQQLLQKYNVSYIVVGSQEKTKYPKISEKQSVFEVIGKKVFESSNRLGALYQINK